MKRIVICADGTWDTRDRVAENGQRRPTNVTKVARAVLPNAGGVQQVVYYHDGVGTRGGVDRWTGGAFGHGMEGNILDLYRFILYNHDAEGDDELYFFGFSRGAFTVRSLAGFMHHVGLIQKDDDYYAPDIYTCYEHGYKSGTDGWKRAFHRITETRLCPRIRFVGVWDTVGALGAPGLIGQIFNRRKYQYHNVGLHDRIEHAYQALAIDEARKPFQPDLWKRPDGWTGVLEQVWYAGVHGNVGGGYVPDGLANIALRWMVDKAVALGLGFDETYLAHYLPCHNSVKHDSMSMKYRLMGDGTREFGLHAEDGEAVHQSAIDRHNLAPCNYRPASLERAMDRGIKVMGEARPPCP